MPRPGRASGAAAVKLFCAQCDSVLGSFKNEWEHITSSYARCKQPGNHAQLKVAKEVRPVPQGSPQNPAEGCEMANVSCLSCEVVVGQKCVKVAYPDQIGLLNCYIYKLRKVYLTDASASKEIEFVFPDVELPPSMPPTTPQQTAPQSKARLSSKTDHISGHKKPLTDQLRTTGGRITSLTRPVLPDAVTEVTQQLQEHRAAIDNNADKFRASNVRIDCVSTRLGQVEGRYTGLNDRLQSIEGQSRLRAVDTYTVPPDSESAKHDETIGALQNTVEKQQDQIKYLMAELYALRRRMDELKPVNASSATALPEISGIVDRSLTASPSEKDLRAQQNNDEHINSEQNFQGLGKRKRGRGRPRKATRQDKHGIVHDDEAMKYPSDHTGPLGAPGISQLRSRDSEEAPISDGIEELSNSVDVDMDMSGDALRRHGGNEAVGVAKRNVLPFCGGDRPDTGSGLSAFNMTPVAAEAIDFSDEENYQESPDASGTGDAPTVPTESAETAKNLDYIVSIRSLSEEGRSEVFPTVKSHTEMLEAEENPRNSDFQTMDQENDNDCASCGAKGKLICCDGCPKSYHYRCLDPPMSPKTTIEGDWYCPTCAAARNQRSANILTTNVFHHDLNDVLRERSRLAQQVMAQEEDSGVDFLWPVVTSSKSLIEQLLES